MGAVKRFFGRTVRASQQLSQAVGLGGIQQALGIESLENKALDATGIGRVNKDGGQTESASDTFAQSQEEELEARRRAISGLTQTSSLGAGSPTTARRQLLGV